MKLLGIIISIALIAVGISCLTMAALGMGTGFSLWEFSYTLLTICLWTALPVIILGAIYFIYNRKNG